MQKKQNEKKSGNITEKAAEKEVKEVPAINVDELTDEQAELDEELSAIESWEKGAEDNSIDVEAVADLPLALRKRVYLLVWGAVASSLEEPLHSAQLRSLDQLVINSSSGPRSPIGKIVSLPGGWTAKRSRKSLIFRKPKTLGVLTPADS